MLSVCIFGVGCMLGCYGYLLIGSIEVSMILMLCVCVSLCMVCRLFLIIVWVVGLVLLVMLLVLVRIIMIVGCRVIMFWWNCSSICVVVCLEMLWLM